MAVSNLGSISVGTQIKVKVTSKETNNYLSANADYTISIEKAAPEAYSTVVDVDEVDHPSKI